MTSTSRPTPADWWVRIDEVVDRCRARRLGPLERDLVLAESLRVLAAALRTGASLQQALVRASQRGPDRVSEAFGSAASRITLGCAIEDEVDRLAARIDTAAARLFAQVVRVQHRRGGDLGGPCHRLASLLHDRARLDGEGCEGDRGPAPCGDRGHAARQCHGAEACPTPRSRTLARDAAHDAARAGGPSGHRRARGADVARAVGDTSREQCARP